MVSVAMSSAHNNVVILGRHNETVASLQLNVVRVLFI